MYLNYLTFTYLLRPLLGVAQCDIAHILLELDFFQLYVLLPVFIHPLSMITCLPCFYLHPIYKQAAHKRHMANRQVKCVD